MSVLDYLVNSLMTVVLIVGSYQFYFFLQRRHVRKPIEFSSSIDELIPFRPGWVWIYTALYYPVILLGVLTIESFAQFNYTAFSFIMLLAMQLLVFLIFPVRTPAGWREYRLEESLSTRFLGLIQRYDAPSNSFPSMHTSVATLTALHLFPMIGPCALAFPALIGLSCVYTKQHYVIDVPAGAALGGFVFAIFKLIY